MKRMLFNATQAEELRVAIVDGQNLMNLDIETLGKEQRKGSIYKGVITRIEPSLEACFVDYGTDRHGFLPFKEISRSYFKGYEGGRARIQDVVSEGTEVIVQVEKDERGNKGAALTTFISLAGRYLVLMPNNPRGGGVSRRIEGEERQDLKNAMAELNIPKGMSLIARTAGIGRSAQDLEWDLSYLLQLWTAVETAAENRSAPFLVLQESALVIRAIRDYFKTDIGEILIDTQDVYDEVFQFMSYVMPNQVSRIKRYEDHIPLFSRFQIEHQIESAFSREVSLPSGGAIVIDHTEALVSIDVNSARSTRGADIEETALRTNTEAAEEIARQLRLRDLGGLVVIDFIDMENTKNQREVEQTLKDALKYDRARVQMGKLSRFGLLELSRQRLQPSLGESSHMSCPRCHGTGFIRGIESSALYILRMIQEEAMKDNTGEVRAQVPVDVATFLLNEKRAELFSLEDRLDVSILLIPNTHLETPSYKLERIRIDDVEENPEASYKTVEAPEEDAVAKMIERSSTKATRPEPAVKGIRHTQRVEKEEVVVEEASLLKRFTGWLKGLFASEPVVEEVKKPAVAPSNQNSRPQQEQQNRNRRQHANKNASNRNNRNQQNQTGNADKDAATTAAGGRENGNNNNRRQNNRNNPNNRNQQNQDTKLDNANGNSKGNNANASNNAPVNASNTEAQGNNNNERRNNNRRQQQPRQQQNKDLVEKAAVEAQVEAQVAAPVVADAANTANTAANNADEGNKNNRRRRNNRNNRNRNNQDDNAAVATPVEQAQTQTEAPLVINVPEPEVATAPKSERNHGHKKNNQRRSRQRRIPRANDIIARIDIHAVAALAREAANVALGKASPVLEVTVAAIEEPEYNRAAAVVQVAKAEVVEAVKPVAVQQDNVVPVEVVVAPVEAIVAPVQAQEPVVEAKTEVAPAPVKAQAAPMPVLDLGNLILVETDRAALELEASKVIAAAQARLRRNEYLASLPVVQEKDSLPLQQVETIKS